VSTPDAAENAPEAAPRTHGLLAPSTLTPVDVDLRTVFWAVTGAFAVARTVAICATGVGLGLLAQGWVRWREASLRRRAARDAA
jgi:hypothetical protein